MTRVLAQKFFFGRRSPIINFWHRVPVIPSDFKTRFQHASTSLYSTERGGVSPISRDVLDKHAKLKSIPRPLERVYAPQWRRAKAWDRIFSPHWDHQRYKAEYNESSYVPLWDIAPGCLLFLKGKTRLAPESLKEVEKYAHPDVCGHHVVVLAVDVKGVNEGTVGLATIRSFSQHQDQCRFLGLDWFDTTHFEIQQRGKNLPPPVEHNIKILRLYKTPCSNQYHERRQLVETGTIFIVPYQELMTEVRFPARYCDSWYPSSFLNGWSRRIIKEDFFTMCENIGFTPDPWVSSGPYMWKEFVKKTGIDTFGLDLEDPALYDEKAFYQQMWEEGQKEYNKFYSWSRIVQQSSNDYSPLGWVFDREPYKGGLIRRKMSGHGLIRKVDPFNREMFRV
ncbi:317a8c15-a2c0-4bf0-ac02-bcc168031d43-CDS [Sclerotinia trifoliorum]|uniref:317a8c15-a2c0-4bf0-ac02-bcc168031d43-CDS n=1 Tax=Sclerotinia trifoliorum TaxID=28548 RepID=A0A8H2ZQT8_9HELO|nr:317a8c15-a2c0-4bf0-ac02-bcc168031d43-CDS [Sclerotinia trifoliorum]